MLTKKQLIIYELEMDVKLVFFCNLQDLFL